MIDWIFESLVRLTIVFTLMVCVIAIVDRLRLGLSSSQRSWLWRAVYLKAALLIVLPTFGLVKIPLPFLTSKSASTSASAPTNQVVGQEQLSNINSIETSLSPSYTKSKDQGGRGVGSSTENSAASVQQHSSESSNNRSGTSGGNGLGSSKIELAQRFERTSSHESDATGSWGSLFTWTRVKMSLVVLWAMGVGVCFALMARSYFRLIRIVRKSSSAANSELVTIALTMARRLKVRLPEKVMLSNRIDSPMILYFGRPILVLPTKFQELYGTDSCRMALAHELAHHRRADLWWNLLASLVSILLFFCPPAWYAARRYYLQMESACDQMAITKANFEPHVYAGLLVQILQNRQTQLASPICLSMVQSRDFLTLKERLQNMTYELCHHRLSGSLVTLLMLGLVVSPWAFADDTPKKNKSNDTRRSASSNQTGSTNTTQNVSGFAQASAGGMAISGGNGRAAGGGSPNSFGGGYQPGFQPGFAPMAQGNGNGFAAASGFAAAGVAIGGAPQADSSNGRTFQPGSSNSTGEGKSIGEGKSTGRGQSIGVGQSIGGASASGNGTSVGNGVTVSRTSDEVDGVITQRTNITTRKERVTIEENDEDGITVSIAPRNKPKDRQTYSADSREELAENHPNAYEWVEKYCKDKNQAMNFAAGMPGGKAGGAAMAGNGSDVRGDKPGMELMKNQLEQMMQDTQDPATRAQLGNMLQQLQQMNGQVNQAPVKP